MTVALCSHYVDTAPKSMVCSNGQQFSQLPVSPLNGK